MRVSAGAKINLYLEITGRDPSDGYHTLDSLFQEISLADSIDIEPRGDAGDDRVVFSGVQIEGRSTVHRALELFRERFGTVTRYDVRVEKMIPVGAGLGGGSSDAGAILLALAGMHGVEKSELLPVAARIGSDVPFFLYGGLCRVTGKGEKIVPVGRRLENVHFVIVWPGRGVETKWAYSLVKTYADGPVPALSGDNSPWNIAFLKETVYNKFQGLVFRAIKELETAKNELDALVVPECSFMSGSGSSLVFSWSEKDRAREALERIRSRYSWPAFLADPVYRN
jgi:4-diphosphocytidyl-2-C-methyl-D-erythritol kinase